MQSNLVLGDIRPDEWDENMEKGGGQPWIYMGQTSRRIYTEQLEVKQSM